MRRLSLSAILFVAGWVHLLRPEAFDSAIPFEPKLAINYFSGVLEILLALGLWPRLTRDRSARLTALWFLLLIPVHVYISWYEIEIFGTSNSVILWLRTFFQPVLYFWALSLQDRGWIMKQTWKDVAFIHYEAEASSLQRHVPFPLDLYQGKAIVSIVSFTMDDIRFPFLPAVPGLCRLNELNLRTYVEVNGVRGVYFFTLDSDSRCGNWIARTFFSLPYRLSKIRLRLEAEAYGFEARNDQSALRFSGKVGAGKASLPFDLWATERYCLFTNRGRRSLRGDVSHRPWSLRDFSLLELEDNFSNLLGPDLKLGEVKSLAYCSSLAVRFSPFESFALELTTHP